MPVHHPAGERNGILSPHRRVFRKDEGDEIIRERFDKAADNRQIPEHQLHARAQMRQRCARPAARVVQVHQSVRRNFLVCAHFKEHAPQDDHERIGDKNPVERGNQTADRDADHQTRVSRVNHRGNRIGNDALQRTA